MTESGTRFVVYLALITIGCALAILGIGWLLFLGVALVSLADYFSVKANGIKSLDSFVMISLLAMADLFFEMQLGKPFVRDPWPLWFCIAILACWLWGIISESRRMITTRRDQREPVNL